MTSKSAFSEAEWKTILASPMLVSTAVSMADPNGIWGVLQEGMASARALLDAKKDAGANELVKALVAEIETSEGREKAKQGLKGELTAKTPAEVKAQALVGLARVNQILAKASPSDAAAFKTWLTQIAERVAQSSTEGGFMGFGGVKVSDAEKASIGEISKALNVV
jgi:hypothetical protein